MLGISGGKMVGWGYFAGVKSYAQGGGGGLGCDREMLAWGGGGGGGQRFGKQETRKVCVFIIRTWDGF